MPGKSYSKAELKGMKVSKKKAEAKMESSAKDIASDKKMLGGKKKAPAKKGK